MQQEEAPAGYFLFLFDVRGQVGLFQRLGHGGVFAFGVGQIAQQLADRGVADFLDGALVEAPRLQLHDLRLLAHRVQAERTHQPHRPAVDEAFDVLAADQRDVLAELLLVELNQAGAVLRLLRLHLLEDHGAGGVGFAQAVGEIAVDAPVFFFERNRQGQNLALGELIEVLRHRRNHLPRQRIARTATEVHPLRAESAPHAGGLLDTLRGVC